MSTSYRESAFVCQLCGDQFSRLEHLNRHILSHTNTRPFSCSQCMKRFTRRDTLNRHEAVHASAAHAGRSDQACRPCAKLKVRCDGCQPCSRCLSKATKCVYRSKNSRLHIPSVVSAEEEPNVPGVALGPTTADMCISQNPELVQIQDVTTTQLSQEVGFDFLPWEESSTTDFNIFDWIAWSASTPASPLPVINTPIPPVTETPEIPINSPVSIDADPSISPSPMDWNPNAADNLVSFPDLDTLNTEFIDIENLGHVGDMTFEQYNAMDRHVSGHNSAYHASRNYRPLRNAHLPPIQVMNCFVQLYFEYFQPLFPMLHLPTFVVGDHPWHLVLAIAAIGCRYSKAITSGYERKWQDAFQELLRRALSDAIEADNSVVRRAWLVQAIILNSVGMYYSGTRRLTEIAEVMRNTPVTQCRRMESMRFSVTTVSISEGSTGERLESQWRQWILEELNKRLSFCGFLIDAQAALYFDLRTCFEPTEFYLVQLPCNEKLWDANTAKEWKQAVMACSAALQPPLVKLALSKLKGGEKLHENSGNFARLVLMHQLHLGTVSICNALKNPSIEEWQTAEFRSKWITSALTALDNLKPDPKPVKVLLFTPRVYLLPLALSRNTTGYTNARKELLRWTVQNKGCNARMAVAYSACLLETLRNYRTLGYYEAIAGHVAILTLWAYSHLTTQSLAKPTEDGYTATIRLDSAQNQDNVSAWVDGDGSIRAHVKDIGNIERPGAEHQIVNVGRSLLDAFTTWGIKDILALGITSISRKT